MRHKRVGRKLGVVTKHRRAMFRNMATDLFRHESITTTDARAKEIRRVAEKMITLAKKGTLQARRQAAAFIKDKDVLKKLFTEIAEKYKDRPGGYTRIIKMGYRRGDNAALSMIEIVQEEYKAKKKKKKTVPKAKQATDTTKKSTKKESAEELGLIENGAKAATTAEAVTEDTAEQNPVETNNETEANVKEETEAKSDTEEVNKTSDINEEPKAEAGQDDIAEISEQEPETKVEVSEEPKAKTEEIPKEPDSKVETSEGDAEAEAKADTPEEGKEEDKKE